MSVRPIDLERFISGTGNIYEAVVVTAKRARQIHQETRIEYNQRVETLQQLMTTTEAEEELENIANPDQLKISLEFEKRPKQTEQALRDLDAGAFEYRYKEPEVQAPETEEEEE
jgi:DNA-directed RNA polymerase subunit K/omega